ncbi:MAG: 2Fe-2S iron-sulfur cluster binding domain-containing protein [Acidobacteria bacterium]|nr:2Fe-2S iron-sulfur cluster binding domain-containing protein [Acidobacteriota bacterium]
MPSITFEGQDREVLPGETVLDCLLRSGVAVPHSCKAGACQSCLMKAEANVGLESAQAGLKDTLRAQGYFLACSLRPSADVAVSLPGGEVRTAARITRLDSLNETVLRVRLRVEEPFPYYPGQFLSLVRSDGLARSYSLASLPHESDLELHVRRIPGGAMSEWLHSDSPEGETVWLQGPAGNCFYVPGSPEEPLLLVGTGTGLAPLYGIARDALAQGHTGPIWMFHGALTPAGLYLTRELQEMSARHANLHYVRAALRDGGVDGVEDGELDACIRARLPKLAGFKAYVCGDPALVNSLRKKLFLAGIASKAIYADAFLPSSSPSPLPQSAACT